MGSGSPREPAACLGAPLRRAEHRAGLCDSDRRAPTAGDLARFGRTAGRLFSVSTVGSIVGTFATAFWLVPELGTDQVLGVGAAVLFAAAAIIALSERLVASSLLALGATVVAAVAVASLAPETGGDLSKAAAQNWSPVYRLRGNPSSLPDASFFGAKVLFRKDTRYHQLAVIEESDIRALRFGSSFQSETYVNDPFKTVFPYTDYFFLGPAYKPDARSMLFLGLGGGSAPKRVWRDFPELKLQVVELDPVVVDVARRFFAVPDDPRLPIAVSDGGSISNGTRPLGRDRDRHLLRRTAFRSTCRRASSSSWCATG